jgi:hypothetical protein
MILNGSSLSAYKDPERNTARDDVRILKADKEGEIRRTRKEKSGGS